jgi:hypothetical protein
VIIRSHSFVVQVCVGWEGGKLYFGINILIFISSSLSSSKKKHTAAHSKKRRRRKEERRKKRRRRKKSFFSLVISYIISYRTNRDVSRGSGRLRGIININYQIAPSKFKKLKFLLFYYCIISSSIFFGPKKTKICECKNKKIDCYLI